MSNTFKYKVGQPLIYKRKRVGIIADMYDLGSPPYNETLVPYWDPVYAIDWMDDEERDPNISFLWKEQDVDKFVNYWYELSKEPWKSTTNTK